MKNITKCTKLGKSMPNNLPRSIVVAEHFQKFYLMDTTDVWTDDGWLVTACFSEASHQLRKGDEVERRDLAADDLLWFSPTEKTIYYGI